jgi:hypothetical protein
MSKYFADYTFVLVVLEFASSTSLIEFEVLLHRFVAIVLSLDGMSTMVLTLVDYKYLDNLAAI